MPSPCGFNSQCRELNEHAVCSCVPDMIGAPPNCRPECILSSECGQEKSCINQKCKDPCPGVCGQNARCQVVNHNPICSCSIGYHGDPFVRCLKEEPRKDLSTGLLVDMESIDSSGFMNYFTNFAMFFVVSKFVFVNRDFYFSS